MIEGFAESTVTATRWIILHSPDKLAEWLNRHERPKDLERIARQEIEEAKQRSALRNG